MLTVLGILIGVSAVVIVTALGTGARERVSKQIESIGSNFIVVFPQNSNVSGARGAAGTGARLTEDDAKTISREAVSIAKVAPAIRVRGQAIYGDKNWSTSILGSTVDFFEVRNWPIARGEAWTRQDESVKAKVVVIGASVKRNLFGDQDSLGKSIRIGRYVYRVIGELKAKGQGPFGGDQDDIVIMPITGMRARLMRAPPGFVGVLMMSATSADTTERAVQQVDSILRQRHRIAEDREPDFVVRTQKEFQEMQSAIYGLLTVLLIAIAAISLVVGGIGIMNIMLVSVAERTREIGIRMAIGAREHDIRSQFLVEAVVLSLLGGLLGVALGFGGIRGISAALEWPMSMSPVALAVSFVTSALTGIGFGFVPARRASRLDPIVALRHE